jgi:chaperonin cofactor prefoldin
MSDPGVGDRPELTRSDYDRLIAVLRASQVSEEKESTTTHRELDKELHGISVRLDQMQQAINGRFDVMQRVFIGAAFLTIACIGYLFVATSQTSVALGRVEGRFDAVDDRFDAVDDRFEGIDTRLDAMDKRFEGIDRRLDAMDKRFDGIDRRLDAMDQRLDKDFEGVDRRLDNIIDLIGQLRPTKQQGVVDKQ